MNDKQKKCSGKKQTNEEKKSVTDWSCFVAAERMILSKEFYERCCPSYKKAIDEFEKNIADIGVINWKGHLETQDEASGKECLAKTEKFCELFHAFLTKYLTPKEYWEYFLHFFEDLYSNVSFEERKTFFCQWAKCAFFYHLYYNQDWNSIDDTRYVNDGRIRFLNAYDGKHFKLLGFQMKHYLRERAAFPRFYQIYNVTEQDFGYPHDRLKECFLQFERDAIRLPSDKLVKQYEKMKALFPKIKAAENDDVETWLKLLLQAGDDIFVMHNVECRLGHDLFNVKLWKLYLTFLKEHGKTNRLVKILSKYCRFFLEDLEMLDELKAELDKHGIISPLDRLCNFDVKEVAEKEDTTQDEEILPFDRSLCSAFYDSTRNQRFSLPKPIIRYIVKNAGHRVLRKLFSSCKYFYAKKPTPICYRLETGVETSYNGERLILQPTANPELFLKKTFITGVIEVVENSHAFMSSLIPRLHRCEAKYITIYFQNLTFDELKCLIQHGCVIELQIQTCKIKDKKGDFVDLEHILAYLPNIEVLSLPKVKTNKNTGNALSKFKFSGKICRFVITSIFGIPFNADEFLKFIATNRDEKMFKCSIFFNVGFNPDFVQKFKKTMDAFAESCANCIINIDFNVDD